MTSPFVQISNVSKTYGQKDAVKDVSLEIDKGEIFSLLGHNGAGKTTLIKMLVGLVQANRGSLKINGDEIAPFKKEVKEQFSYLPETMSLFPHLSARETLRFFGRLQRIPKEREDEVLSLVGLSDYQNQKVGSFSKGMSQRLGFALSLLPQAPLLILDEPTSGMDPFWAIQCKQIIKQLNQDGATIIFASHVLSEVEEMVDRVCVMNEGEIIALGSVKELKQNASDRVKVKALFDPDISTDELSSKIEHPMSIEKGWHVISCKYEDKLEVMRTVQAYEQLKDIEIKEITLEDIYHNLYDKND